MARQARLQTEIENAFFLPKVKGRFWITKEGFQAVKIEFVTLDTISWGGIVARVSKGTRVSVEMTRVNNEVWLPKRILVSGSARVLLVKDTRASSISPTAGSRNLP